MGTAMSYLVLVVGTVAAYYYYNPAQFKRILETVSGQQAQAITPEITQSSKRFKQKRSKQVFGEEKGTSTPVSSNEAPASKKRKIISEPVKNTVDVKTSAGTKATLPRVDGDGIDDADFARQLKQAQQGTKLQPQVQQAVSKKDRRTAKTQVKQSVTNGEAESAETSSNGGRDADDDMSPVDTPPSSASRAGDVSDMLEPSGPKVSSIKLTNTESTQTKKAAPKQFEAAQTKKQRQRQKQNEENRKLREESDKQHAAKMHQQIHGARMAEGTSKQTKASTFTQNAWQSKPSQPEAQPEQPAHQSLLDTFEPSDSGTKSSVTVRPMEDITNQSKADVNQVKERLGEEKTQALAASERERPELTHKESWADQLNEEAQEQWEKDLVEDEQWESVTTKKGKKKAKKENDTSSEASLPANNLPTTFASATKTSATSNGTQATSNGTTHARPQTMNRFESVAGDEWEA